MSPKKDKSGKVERKFSAYSVDLGKKKSGPFSYSQLLWENSGATLPDVRRLIAGVSGGSRKVKEDGKGQEVKPFVVKTYAYSLPREIDTVESIVMNGILVYMHDGKGRAASRPMACGGRFRLSKSMFDGEVVAATLYLLDVPSKPGERLEWSVIGMFRDDGTHKQSEDNLPPRDAKGRFIRRKK